ncbi:histidine kinase [Candidatus Nitrosarchaeum limnium SFB1]|uniref:Histidine kinase n=1 Tax=Candidatus Nitrosarchaeum limnium SFB1 TaxID=886738 RepID=F3KLD2_9ARCH|nr:histidine kinase [Candidatus Nitrosarchaeum limnium SFB1]
MILPGILLGISIVLTLKLFKQGNSQFNAFVFFTIGASLWFIAEQIWTIYDVYHTDPFPSIADIFYLSAYPFFIIFFLISLKPIRKNISKKIWLFSFILSFAFCIPSIVACLDSLQTNDSLDVTAKSIALSYPILSSFQLVPVVVGIMFLAKKDVSYFWMLLLFGFLIYCISDTFFLFSQLNNSYYDGHPVDVMYLYSFTFLIYALYNRLKLTNNSDIESQEMFTDKIKFETITKFGIPLTLMMFSLIVIISLISAFYYNFDNEFSVDYVVPGVIVMIAIFFAIIFILNKNMTRFVQMKTNELEEQKNNLTHIIDKKTQELLKAERLSTIGELSGRLAHDLRNPLSVIKISLDLLKQSPADTKISDDVTTKRLELIESSVERISHQIDDVLDYVRNSPLKLSRRSIRKIILGSIEKISVPHNIKILVSGLDAEINCDYIKIDAAFINLILNSIQANPEGGTIEIKIKSDHDDVIIDFIDSGSGIPDEVMNQIFEPLFTTKQQGTGLGLASCKNIVELHKGKITVKNNPTTFTVRLPKNLES